MSAPQHAHLTALAELARDLHHSPDAAAHPWPLFERAAMRLFGASRLFTVTAYDAAQSLVWRLHSNQASVSPPGGAKRVTASAYAAHIYQHGQCFVGSTRADLKVFSEYESLWAIGCESVLNIPVRDQGQTIGTLNLLGAAQQYDGYDSDVAHILSRLAVPPMLQARQTQRDTSVDVAALDSI